MLNRSKISRRSFAMTAFATLATLFSARRVSAQGLPKPTGGDLTESDPVAKALGYHVDASKVDTKVWAKKAGPDGAKQVCTNCQLYQPQAGEPSKGGCTLFPNRWVAAKGWCNGYIPKA